MDTQVGAGEPRTLGPLAYPSILVEHDDVFDGRSLYRALARQHTGNPSNFLNVMNGVLDLYLRIWANPIHQDKDQIRKLDNLDCGRLKTFFNALACPDNIELELYDQVVGFIADALNVRISTFTWCDEEGGLKCVSDLGKSFVPSYDIWRRQETCRYEDGFEERLFVFHSLLADESGTPLMIYLEKQKIAMDGESRGRTQTTRYNGLQLKKLCWWWRTDENQDAFDKRPDDAYGSLPTSSWWFQMRWYNEHEANAPPAPRLDDMRDSLAVFTISVSTPAQIRPALRLLNEALEIAPAQEIPVNSELAIGVTGKRALRRYVAIDAEFVIRDGEIGDAAGDKFELEMSRGENLCSVLTVAVDRHLVFSFYIMHMLENPTEQTVPQLSVLFRELLFGDGYLKVWWNYGEDFAVLDATIAHMFQGTPRPRYWKTPWSGSSRWVQPYFKVKSDHYGAERPADLTFSRESVPCVFHEPGENEQRMACPCRLGNVDLSIILDKICRQLGLAYAAEASSSGLGQRQWWQAKFGNNYSRLLDWLLGQDRLYPLLNYLKEGAARSGNKDAFYQSLGPGMETDIDKMGYNVGDVVGIALIMRYLTTTDDRLLLAGRLSRYACMLEHGQVGAVEQQRLVQPRSSSTLQLPQIEDNPRLWRRARLTSEMDIASKFETSAINTAWNSYVRHEEVANCARERWRDTTGASREIRRENAIRNAYLDVFDPTEFSLPETIFTSPVPTGHQDCADKRAIVRTGKGHDDDLLDFIRSRRSRKTLPPRGFLAEPDSELSLPSRWECVAGETLRKHPQLAAAFSLRNELRPGTAIFRRPGVRGYFKKPRSTIARVVGAWGDTDEAVQDWDQGRIRQEAADRQAKADQMDAEEGPPAEYRPELIFDPDGRQHNRNITGHGILKSQVYSPWDVARLPNPGRLPDNLMQQLRVLLNTKEWNEDEEDVDPGEDPQPSVRRVKGGRGGGYRSQRGSKQNQSSGKWGRRGRQRGRGGGNGGNRGGAVAELTRSLGDTGLRNSFAAWEKQTLGKRVRFGGVEDGEDAEGKGDSRMTKSVKVY